MSSPKVPSKGRIVSRRVFLGGVGVTMAATLAGCGGETGFQPLYGPTASGVRLDDKLAQVDIAKIPSRVGQRIRNELIFNNTGGGSPAPPLYTLEITIREGINSTLVRSSGEALSQVYSIDAGYRLISIKDKKILLQGVSHARAAFERNQSVYANVRAREDAENRAARTIAEEVKLRLTAFLSRAPV